MLDKRETTKPPLPKQPSRLSFGLAPLLALSLMVISICWLAAAAKESTQAKSTEDLPAGAMQAKAGAACEECHESRIIVQQRLSKAAWTREVDKMIKWGAVVDSNDRDALIDYLSSHFGPEQPPYDPPRTAQQKKEKPAKNKE